LLVAIAWLCGTIVEARADRAPEAAGSSRLESPGSTAAPDIDDERDAPAQVVVPTIPLRAADETPAAAPAARKRAQLEEIIVTATKRAEPLRDLAASIDAFDGRELESQGKMSLADFVETTPGVVMNTLAPGMLRITVRGINAEASPVTTLPSPTGIFIGDVAFNDPYIANIQPDLSAFDLAGVEVLKGPQGTLFGGSALAGAIRYLLREPVMGQWQARSFMQYLDVSGGSHSLTGGAAVNVPLYRDELAMRLAYVKRDYPGVNDIDRTPRLEDVDDAGGEQLRGMLRWRPLDELEVKLTHLRQDFAMPNLTVTSDSPPAREIDKRIFAQPSDHDFTLDSLELSWDFDTLRAVSLTSRNTKDLYAFADTTAEISGPPPEDFDPDNGAFAIVNDESRSLAQELRLQSTAAGGLEWLVGAYAYDYKVFFDFLLDTVRHRQLFGDAAPAGPLGAVPSGPATLYEETSLLYTVSDVRAREHALFFDISRGFGKRLELSAGARLYRTQVRGESFRTGVLARSQNDGQNLHLENQDITETGVNPRLAAVFGFTPDISAYLLASRGFRFGGLQSVPSNATTNVPPVYKSDSIWSYEAGLRTSWLDDTLQLDAAVFYIDYQDPQIRQTTSAPRLAYIDNVGAAVSKGIEASLRWSTPIEGLMLDLAGGLTDARTTEPFTAAGGIEVPAGARMPGAADSQYAALLAYAPAPLGRFRPGARLEYTYIGKGYADITQVHRINDYGTLNGGITLSARLGSFEPQLAISVSNLLDATAVKFASTTTPTMGESFDTFLLNAPRTISVRLGLEF
jgi:iron complex outermembrane recepter protein